MHTCASVTEKVFWLGTNDRKTARFENYLPLPNGVTYNSYLIKDTKTCLIDTVEFSNTSNFLEKISEILEGRALDYVVVNHMEPDHSGALHELIKYHPEVKVIGNAITLKMIKAFYHDFDASSFVTVKEGDILDLGEHRLTFVPVPMLHWPESMVTYDLTEKILFSNDAFGGFGTLDGGIFDDEVNFSFFENEMRRYYANIVGKYGNQVTNAITKLEKLEIKYICPSHGIVWRKNLEEVIGLYSKLGKFIPQSEGVVIVYGTLYGNTAKMADVLARALSKEGITEVKVYDASQTDASFIISDIWKYKGLILGSAAHNNTVYPKLEPILSKILNYGLKNRYVGIFGNKLWSGGGVRGIQAVTDQLNGIEIIGEPIEAMGAPTEEDYLKLEALAKEIAAKLKSERKECLACDNS